MTVSFANADGNWTIRSLSMDKQEILTTTQPVLQTLLSNRPFHYSTLPRLEALRRGGYAITVGDIDGDTDADIYVVDGAYNPMRTMVTVRSPMLPRNLTLEMLIGKGRRCQI